VSDVATLPIDAAPVAARCGTCGTDVAPGVLACPGCHRLVHADALKKHRDGAEAAARAGDVQAELAAWRLAVELLPPQSKQYTVVQEKIAALSQSADAAPVPDVPQSGPWKWLGGLGTAGVLLWKFKFLVVALATKGKLLLLGLTKASTFFSMFLAFGVYWAAWGMWFAFGLVLSIYVHEMGHVFALRRFGIAATAPMFVPGLGALIRLRGQRLSPREDARIGLAGPMWGLAAALAALAGSAVGGGPMWTAIAHVGAWINLFNLLPVWQLDGNRGFAALARPGRLAVAAAFAGGWMIAGDGLFFLLILVAGGRAFSSDAAQANDRGALTEFIFLILALAVVFRLAA
jgi:Zn-dependent protease